LSFAEWLARVDPGIELVEHPTTDFEPIDIAKLASIEVDVLRRLSEGRTVLIVDSGGETRTRQVCKRLGAREAPTALT
jgi:hypothetical protein